jgi:hypothetical protein
VVVAPAGRRTDHSGDFVLVGNWENSILLPPAMGNIVTPLEANACAPAEYLKVRSRTNAPVSGFVTITPDCVMFFSRFAIFFQVARVAG